MKLRAIIFGIQEYEEHSCDYKNGSDESILAAQRLIASEDATSFCTPDTVKVFVFPGDTDCKYLKDVLVYLEQLGK